LSAFQRLLTNQEIFGETLSLMKSQHSICLEQLIYFEQFSFTIIFPLLKFTYFEGRRTHWPAAQWIQRPPYYTRLQYKKPTYFFIGKETLQNHTVSGHEWNFPIKEQ